MTQGNSVKGYKVTEAERQVIEHSLRSIKSVVFKNGYIAVRNKGQFTMGHWTEVVGGFAIWAAIGTIGGVIGQLIQTLM